MKKFAALILAFNFALPGWAGLALAATGCTYPSTLDTFSDVVGGATLGAALFNKLQCSAEKIEAELGTNPKGGYATVVARLNDAVYTARTITAGTGLTGGGTLAADRTIAVDTAVVATLTGAQTISNHTLDNSNTINVKDTLFRVQDDGDPTKQGAFQASGITTGTTRTYTLPNADGTLVLTSRSVATGTGLSGGGDLSSDRTLTIDSTVATLTGSQTLSNKTLDDTTVAVIKDANFSIVDDGDVTKVFKFQGTGISTGTTRTYTVPNADGTLLLQSRAVNTGTGLSGGGDLSADRTIAIDSTVATLTGSQSLTNKTLDNSNIATLRDDRFTLQDNVDTSKQAAFQLSSIGTGTTRTYTLPNANGIVVLESASVTNSGITLDSNSGLQTTSGLSLKRDCTDGQILKWTSSSSTWGCAADASSAGVTVNAWGSRGQRSKNNTGTPNTKFDLIADSVVLRNSSNETVVINAPSTVTNDITVSNASDNGRDQSGAFSASSWLHFYWVWDGATLKSRSSTVAPPTGPTLQGGETHWAYAGAVRLNSSSQLLSTTILGSRAFYEIDGAGVTRVLNGGAATGFTTVDASALIPPNSREIIARFICSATHTSIAAFIAYTRTTGSGLSTGMSVCTSSIQVANQEGDDFAVFPIVSDSSQQFDYRLSAAPSVGGLYVDVIGYQLPNGGT